MANYFNEIKRILKDLEYWEKELILAFANGKADDIDRIYKIIRALLKKLHYYITLQTSRKKNPKIESLNTELYFWRRKFEEARAKGDLEGMIIALAQIRRVEIEIRKEQEKEDEQEPEMDL